MYQRDVSCGASPDFATVKETPFEPYVGFPCVVKLVEGPCVKSILTDLPKAESGGQLVESMGLQFVYV